ncbi:ribonuclease III [Aquicella lusitana]|uniref:Ribonuclease 3 n=1 Tax=Aquicella lusitana TaxID=254246 RepID=A0A370GHH5_9COXI|nr:ribonuclease III [Aquicella lusitana]RDI42696.1 RNAse III [Aquicella lusitana]VVC73449.1 Ribonuclease 3 [Aquicella lusitana]
MSDELTSKLNYVFQQPKLLKVALTHRSKGGDHNERLEFLGDAVVNFVIAEILYHQFPKATEGELSRWRATLVNRDTLAELAKEFELGRYLFLGPGELRSGGSERQSILSCAMEAIIGAVYLDGGFDAARACIMAWYEPWLQSLSTAASHKDPKTLLQEYLQSRRMPLPVYTVEAIEGEAHQQRFTVSCQVEGVEQKTRGKGTSRRRAEQDAALAMLGVLKK